MGAETHDSRQKACLARAISSELSRLYPHHTAKSVARDLACTPKAAANLLDGHLSAASVARLIQAYGPGWVAERVLEAGGTTLEAYIEESAEAARREQAAWGQKVVGYNSLLGRLRDHTPRASGADREMAGRGR